MEREKPAHVPHTVEPSAPVANARRDLPRTAFEALLRVALRQWARGGTLDALLEIWTRGSERDYDEACARVVEYDVALQLGCEPPRWRFVRLTRAD